MAKLIYYAERRFRNGTTYVHYRVRR